MDPSTDRRFHTFYAVSANRHRFWSLEAGRAIGYVPVDDASAILGVDVAPDPDDAQAGDFASQEFTLRHM